MAAATSAATAAAETTVRKAPFVLGRKQVFLPSHRVFMIPPRRNQSPMTATFQVPLRFNKLDLRDYLYNVYGVETTAVRSWQSAKRPEGGHRPRPDKYMQVDLVKPFVYPAVPEDTKEWDSSLFKQMTGFQESGRRDRILLQTPREQQHTKQDHHVDRKRIELAEQARAYLTGKKVWSNDLTLDEKWQQIQQTEEAQREKRLAASGLGTTPKPAAKAAAARDT